MNWKKVVSVLLAGMMTLSMAACGDSASNKSADAGSNSVAGTEDAGSKETSGDDAAESGEKLVIWTLADDLIDFGEKFQEETGTTVETVVIEPADYPTKLQTALLAGEREPDIVVGEPQMLEDFFDAGFFEDLDQFGAQDYPTILDTAQKIKDAGYRIFASDAEINYFSGDSAWVVDNKLNVAQARLDYMDICVELYQQDLTAYASQWATPWYMAMAGEVPLLTAETQWGTDDMNIWDAENFKDDENAVYGNQKLYSFWLEQAQGIDYSLVTRYDKSIGDAWGNAISGIKTGEKTKEDAINEFYDYVESTFPEIEVTR